MTEYLEIMKGSGEGLVEFLTRCAERGEVNRTTALAMRTSARKILAVESDDLSSVDVRTLDINDLVGRFVQLNRAGYSDGSLETYRGRFRVAIAMYIAWLANEPGWKTAGRMTGRTVPVAAPKRPARVAAPGGGGGNDSVIGRGAGRVPRIEARASGEVSEPSPAETASAAKLMSYDVPLRPDLIVRLTLPVDLSVADAGRLNAFVSALAFADIPVNGSRQVPAQAPRDDGAPGDSPDEEGG